MIGRFDYSKPFRVRVILDCRYSLSHRKRMDGKFGECLGLYKHPSIDDKIPDDLKQGSSQGRHYIPLIKLDSGSYIWGSECFYAQESWTKTENIGALREIVDIFNTHDLKKMGIIGNYV